MKKTGSGDKVLDAVMIVAALVMFFKTADVLGYFAPVALNGIFGFDVSYLFGAVNALFVEATMLALHFNRRAHNHNPAKIAKWILLAISASCQIFDGFIATNTLAQQSDELKFFFQYGVPSITTLVVIMLLAIGSLPDETEPVPYVGLKDRLPDFKRIWYGDNGSTVAPVAPRTGNDNGNGQNRQKVRVNWQTVAKNFTRKDYIFIAGGGKDEVMARFDIPERTYYHWQTKAEQWLKRHKS